MAQSTRSAVALDCAYCSGALEPDGGRSAAISPLCWGARDLTGDDAAQRLRAELSGPNRPRSTVVLGSLTDPYLGPEARAKTTRSVLQVLAELGHPVLITTRSARVVRDLDLLSTLADRNLARIFMAIATLDAELAQALEPHASAPMERIDAIRQMAAGGLHIGVLLAPVIPGLTSTDLESVLEAAAASGAAACDYALLRLTGPARQAFSDWLTRCQPDRAERVIGLLEALNEDGTHARGARAQGRAGAGYRAPLARRFDLACRRFLLDRVPSPLCCQRFEVPPASG